MQHHLKNRLGAAVILFLMLFPLFSSFAQGASLSGLVFLDSNKDGLYNTAEKTLQGAEVTLCLVDEKSEQIIGHVKSDQSGQFRFSGLKAGEYYLQISLPDDLVFTTPTAGGSAALPGDGSTSRTPLFQVKDDDAADLLIGSIRESAFINIIAFGDENMNGGRFSSEPLLQGVQIDLIYTFEDKPYIIVSKATNREGFTQFKGLTPGIYQIAVTMPAPYIIGPLGQKTNIYYNVIPPTSSSKGISKPFDTGRSIGLGVGGVKSGSLEGRVWLDSNMNGLLEQNEGGQAGIELTLKNPDLDVTRTLMSGEDATFRFDELQPGNYTIKASLPEGVMFAKAGSPSLFQDGFNAQQSANISIKEGLVTQLDPIGVMPASGVTVIAYHDVNFDGRKDEGEPAFSGALVEALADNRVAASALSNNEGIALLPRVRGGEVAIRVTLPDGQVFSVSGGDGGNAFYDVSAVSTATAARTLDDGAHLTLYAGVTLPASISGTLFLDSNLSGVWDSAEGFLAEFTVQAIDENGNIAAQAQSDASGRYLLGNLVPSAYYTRFLLISPYVFSEPSQTGASMENKVTTQFVGYGQTELLPLLPGQHLENVDAGLFRSALINGAILLGDDTDDYAGKRGGLADVQIQLTDENGLPVSDHTVATSLNDGSFSLKGALPGTYRLRYSLPENAKFSLPFTDEFFFLSEMFEVKESEVLKLDPLFAVKTGTLTGIAFEDKNNDGSLNDGDPGLPGASVKMTQTRSGEVYETLSNEDGLYKISGLRPGLYDVTVTLPEGFCLDANEHSLVPSSLSGVSKTQLDVLMGAEIRDTVLACVKPILINGVSFYDNDLDLRYSAEIDQPYKTQFTLTHIRTGSEFPVSTDEKGMFSLTSAFPDKYEIKVALPPDHLLTAPPFAKQDGGVWLADVTLQETSNVLELAFVQKGSLSGAIWNMDGSATDIAGLTVELRDTKGLTLQTTSTDASGAFAFSDLLPIEYKLYAQLPDLYRFARQVDTAQHVSVITSDLAGKESAESESGVIKLLMGEHKTDQDIGMGAPGKLGDFAWLDLDHDGMQDAGEPGIPDVLIQLFQYGELAAETQTDAYGRYIMTGLYPGSYTLKALMPAEVMPTIIQTAFPLVASVLLPDEEQTGIAKNIIVPSGGRNLNCDLGFVLRKEGQLPPALLSAPSKDWTQVNEQKPKRY